METNKRIPPILKWQVQKNNYQKEAISRVTVIADNNKLNIS